LVRAGAGEDLAPECERAGDLWTWRIAPRPDIDDDDESFVSACCLRRLMQRRPPAASALAAGSAQMIAPNRITAPDGWPRLAFMRPVGSSASLDKIKKFLQFNLNGNSSQGGSRRRPADSVGAVDWARERVWTTRMNANGCPPPTGPGRVSVIIERRRRAGADRPPAVIYKRARPAESGPKWTAR
jgi:hypothetical protein